jgi:DnaJ-class molecular chaperone
MQDDDGLRKLFEQFQGLDLELVFNSKSLFGQFTIQMLRSLRAGVDREFDRLIEQLSTTKQPFNPFEELGVSPDASQDEVKRAYRERARRVHPDRGGSNEQMARLNLAYEVIRRFKGWK